MHVYLGEQLLYLSPLALYAFLRLFLLIRSRAWRAAFGAVFLVILAGYPVAESFADRAARGGPRLLLLAGYATLPLLLYLVLAVVLSDAVIGALRLTGLLSRETVRRPAFRRTRFQLLLAIPVLVVAAGIVNYGLVRVKMYSVEAPRKSSSAERLRIAFAADFHLGDLTSDRFMERFTARVNALEPDIVLLGGDIVEGNPGDPRMKAFAAAFRNLRAPYGIFAVPGNHESFGGGSAGFYAEAGVPLLRDSAEKIADAVLLVGRNDSRRSRRPLEELLGGRPVDLPIIVLDHRPTDYDAAEKAGAAIVLSGHTHNGQLFPVNLLTRRQYPLSWGHLARGGTHFFVTSGVQLWGPRVRTAGRSEILLIDVAFRHGP